MRQTVIQFGEGNFLRGFFDYFLHKMNEAGLYDGKAVVIQPRPGGKCNLLNAQNCEYNLYARGLENSKVVQEHTYIRSIARCVDPYLDFAGFLKLADNPDFRFIVSNTTEAGIVFDESCCFTDSPCKGFPAKLTQLLYRRYQNGLGGFVILPCELIDDNGAQLRKCVLQYAKLWNLEADFVSWLENENDFVNTLVDRIVTGYPNDEIKSKHPEDKFLNTAEIFHLWVIEGNFEEELPLQAAGFNVVWTNDAKPYKKIKVRILNGAHTSLVAGALLSGIETVGEAMEDAVASAFLRKCMQEEILPTLGETEESLSFANSVFDRFRNPFICHKWRSIALNSVSKFSARVLPTILEYKEKNGAYPKCLSLSLAYLIYFYKKDTPEDSESAVKAMQNGSIAEILADSTLWQRDLSEMTELVTGYYDKIEILGAKEAMKWILTQ